MDVAILSLDKWATNNSDSKYAYWFSSDTISPCCECKFNIYGTQISHQACAKRHSEYCQISIAAPNIFWWVDFEVGQFNIIRFQILKINLRLQARPQDCLNWCKKLILLNRDKRKHVAKVCRTDTDLDLCSASKLSCESSALATAQLHYINHGSQRSHFIHYNMI